MATMMLCTQCLTTAKPKLYTKGSIIIELAAWLLLIVPGLFYSLWRHTSRYRGCPACGSPALVALNSPRAQQLMGQGLAFPTERSAGP